MLGIVPNSRQHCVTKLYHAIVVLGIKGKIGTVTAEFTLGLWYKLYHDTTFTKLVVRLG